MSTSDSPALGTLGEPSTAELRLMDRLSDRRGERTPASLTWGMEDGESLDGTLTVPQRRALVVIVDDRTAPERPDSSGPLVAELLAESGFHVDGRVSIAADAAEIRATLNTAVIGGVDLVVTVGGTGILPRDVVPDVTGDILDREIPGIAEALRSSGLAAGSLDAGLSRGRAGISGSTLVVNLAGSRGAIRDGMATLGGLVGSVISQLATPLD